MTYAAGSFGWALISNLLSGVCTSLELSLYRASWFIVYLLARVMSGPNTSSIGNPRLLYGTGNPSKSEIVGTKSI